MLDFRSDLKTGNVVGEALLFSKRRSSFPIDQRRFLASFATPGIQSATVTRCRGGAGAGVTSRLLFGRICVPEERHPRVLPSPCFPWTRLDGTRSQISRTRCLVVVLWTRRLELANDDVHPFSCPLRQEL